MAKTGHGCSPRVEFAQPTSTNMKQLILFIGVAVVSVGCSGGDPGQAPPPHKAMTQAEIDAMPPEARASMQSAMGQSESMVQQNGVAKGK